MSESPRRLNDFSPSHEELYLSAQLQTAHAVGLVPKRLRFSYSVGDQRVQRQAATGDSVGHLRSSSLKVMDGAMDGKTGVQGEGSKLNLTDSGFPSAAGWAQ